MDLDTAKDFVDAYGPNASNWPSSVSGELDALASSSSEFSDYLDDARKIDALLDHWQEDADGADIDSDDDTPPSDDEGADDDLGEPNADPIDFDASFAPDMDELLAAFIERHVIGAEDGELTVFSRDRDDWTDIITPDQVDVQALKARVAKSSGVLQKDLRRLMAARVQKRRRPGLRQGRINAPSLHRVFAGDDRVFYKREEKQDIDTAVSLVVDCSGSMYGERIQLAAEAAYAIASVLDKLGIAFECAGFTASTRLREAMADQQWMKEVREAAQKTEIGRYYPIDLPKFKAFEERWGTEIQSRFAHVADTGGGIELGSTPEGCGVDWAARRLLRRPEERKIMMVLTDGEPGSHILSNRMGGNPYARYSAEVVEACTKAGIDMIGIGICHDGPRHYYPHSCVVNNISELPAQLIGQLKRFLLN